MKGLSAVLVANRGEIAVRVLRACRELGLRAVAVYSEADEDALHVRCADEARLLGPAPARQSYLDVQRIIAAALQSGVDAVHPGYGFLAESEEFAAAVADAGLVFVGPPPKVIATMGDKLAARAVAEAAGVPVLPGTAESVSDPAEALAFAERHGFPIAVKAVHGGGGRGLQVVSAADELEEALGRAAREAAAAFGRGACYLERLLSRPRHVEVQVLGDAHGDVIHLGDRDCTLQRRHQKLVEEAPAPRVPAALRDALADAALRVARHVGYVSAGTCEFLVDQEASAFYFLEMNTRLQVEHPVTELVTGVDLVHAQLRVAAGEPLPCSQEEVSLRGHAIEVRVNAEDPTSAFAPRPGTVTRFDVPARPWTRVDAGVTAGGTVPAEYDSTVGKIVVWGRDREDARRRMLEVLRDADVRGVPTTIPFHRLALEHPDFVAVRHCTASVDVEWDLSTLTAAEPAQEPATGGQPGTVPARVVAVDLGGRAAEVVVYGQHSHPTGEASLRRPRGAAAGDRAVDAAQHDVLAPMQGMVLACMVETGDHVATGDVVVVIEAMKMENRLPAHREGVVTAVRCAAGDRVEQGTPLVMIEPLT